MTGRYWRVARLQWPHGQTASRDNGHVDQQPIGPTAMKARVLGLGRFNDAEGRLVGALAQLRPRHCFGQGRVASGASLFLHPVPVPPVCLASGFYRIQIAPHFPDLRSIGVTGSG